DAGGGGRFQVTIEPTPSLIGFDLTARGEILTRRARAVVASLPRHIAERELKIIGQKLSWDNSCLRAETVEGSAGPGNIVTIEIESGHVNEGFTGFCERGLPPQAGAHKGVKEVGRRLSAQVPAGVQLGGHHLPPRPRALA